MSWDDFVSYVQTKFDFPIALTSPYKLCDFKPAYGYIFREFITDYTYWGHCDCDLVWGRLSPLYTLTNKGYERIGIWGHLSLYKNTREVCEYFKTLYSKDVVSYQVVFSDSKSYSFDEFEGMNKLLTDNNKSVNEDRLFDDIVFYTTNFFTRRKFMDYPIRHSTPCYFVYERGKLTRRIFIKNKWEEDESLYVHLQKRKMKIETANTDCYTIIPDRFVETGIFTDRQLYQMCKVPFLDVKYYKMILKSFISIQIKKVLKWAK